MVVETSVSQTLTALELRSLLAQLETVVWGQMMASHMVLQETVVNALVSIIMQLERALSEPLYSPIDNKILNLLSLIL